MGGGHDTVLVEAARKKLKAQKPTKVMPGADRSVFDGAFGFKRFRKDKLGNLQELAPPVLNLGGKYACAFAPSGKTKYGCLERFERPCALMAHQNFCSWRPGGPLTLLEVRAEAEAKKLLPQSSARGRRGILDTVLPDSDEESDGDYDPDDSEDDLGELRPLSVSDGEEGDVGKGAINALPVPSASGGLLSSRCDPR